MKCTEKLPSVNKYAPHIDCTMFSPIFPANLRSYISIQHYSFTWVRYIVLNNCIWWGNLVVDGRKLSRAIGTYMILTQTDPQQHLPNQIKYCFFLLSIKYAYLFIPLCFDAVPGAVGDTFVDCNPGHARPTKSEGESHSSSDYF